MKAYSFDKETVALIKKSAINTAIIFFCSGIIGLLTYVSGLLEELKDSSEISKIILYTSLSGFVAIIFKVTEHYLAGANENIDVIINSKVSKKK